MDRSAETVKVSLRFSSLLQNYIQISISMPGGIAQTYPPPSSPTSATNIDTLWNSSEMRENGTSVRGISDENHDLNGSYS